MAGSAMLDCSRATIIIAQLELSAVFALSDLPINSTKISMQLRKSNRACLLFARQS